MINTQSQNATRQQNPSAWKYLLRIATIIGGVIAAAGTLLTFYQWFVSASSVPAVDFEVIDSQCLTKVSDVPGLESCFLYKGRQVRNLWVSKVRLVNTCRRNIIGTPGHDLMSSNVCFSVSQGFKMMAADIESCDFDGRLGFGTNNFFIAFSKWRPNQKCVVKIFCEDVLDLGEYFGPQFATAFDPFTQGEINISSYRTKIPTCSIMQKLPHWGSVVLTGVGVCVYGVILAICLWGLFIKIGWWRMFWRRRWEKKHLVDVNRLIASQATQDSKNSLSIDKMPEEFWTQNDIPRPPKSSPFVKCGRVDLKELLPVLIIIFIFMTLAVISLLALIRI